MFELETSITGVGPMRGANFDGSERYDEYDVVVRAVDTRTGYVDSDFCFRDRIARKADAEKWVAEKVAEFEALQAETLKKKSKN